jgi:hypothetical protein
VSSVLRIGCLAFIAVYQACEKLQWKETVLAADFTEIEEEENDSSDGVCHFRV